MIGQERLEPTPAPADLGGRDRTLDVLRGYFLFVMIIDHLKSFPSIFEVLTGRGLMWASAAEGFVFLSGLLVGVVHGEGVRRGNRRAVSKRLLARAAKLYAASVALTLLFTAIGRGFDYHPYLTNRIHQGPAWQVILEAVLLRYSYGLAGILPIYALFLAVTPLWLFAIGRGWLVASVTASVCLWVTTYFLPRPLLLTASHFSETCWQLLFFAGVTLGFYRTRVQDAWAKLESHTEMAVFRLLGLATALTLYLSYWDVYRQPLLPEFRRYVDAALDDVKLGPGRVAIFALWMAFLWLLLKRNEGVVLRTIGRVLEPLGQNSLYVYVVHSLVLFPLAGHRTQDFWQASLRGALVVLLIWLMVRRRVLFSVIPR